MLNFVAGVFGLFLSVTLIRYSPDSAPFFDQMVYGTVLSFLLLMTGVNLYMGIVNAIREGTGR
jgi:hypothetical protein